MCSAHHLRLSTSEISDVTASMPSLGYFALQHRVAPPRKAYSLTSSAFLEAGTPCPFLLFTPVFRGSHKLRCTTILSKYDEINRQKKNCSTLTVKRFSVGTPGGIRTPDPLVRSYSNSFQTHSHRFRIWLCNAA